MAMKGATKNNSVHSRAGDTSTQGRTRSDFIALPPIGRQDRRGPRSVNASGHYLLQRFGPLLSLQHLGPQILHLLVEIGIGRRVGLRAGEEAGLLVEA